ncbi:MAG: phosphate acyltransferase PlsX [Syntrophomonadaceae bacterium]|jgi:glycerol-3-phosphate acyltransferase PlsX|nr:phosphate acyltransferase PlsX [Syntrophomonadaceae bacterium]
MRIAVDAMGGDHAPREIVAGALQWAQQNEGSIILVGLPEQLERELANYDYDHDRITLTAASQVIGMDESPAQALRRKKDASIIVATKLVKEGKADAVLSCGSTGAQMAAAIFILGRLPGIERPPVVTALPNAKGTKTVLIDVGANVDCRPRQLLQFGILGSLYASSVLNITSPRVALINNGQEEGKGNQLSLEAYALLKDNRSLNFVGNIEGRDIFADQADVVVCDGFVGNIILKTIEGMAIFIAQGVSRELGTMPKFFAQLDYTKYGGAPLLGIDGISVVCHGSSNQEAVFNGICVAADCVEQGILELQKESLTALENAIPNQDDNQEG